MAIVLLHKLHHEPLIHAVEKLGNSLCELSNIKRTIAILVKATKCTLQVTIGEAILFKVLQVTNKVGI